MILEHFIKATLLSEGRYEIVLQRYPQFKKEIEQFKKEDQSGNLKYLLWQVKQLEQGERADEISSLTKQFHTQNAKLKEKDINKYKTLGDLRFAFEALSKKEEIKLAAQDAEKIYEDERYLVIFPKTKEASQKYGIDTKWCISATESENMFYQYLMDTNGVFYFIIDKARETGKGGDPLSKVALLYKRNKRYSASLDSVYDTNDRRLSNSQAFSSIDDDETLSKIKAAINNHLQSKPKIEYIEKIKKAQDVNSSAEALATLAKDKDVDIRQYVASNTSASAEALATLAKDEDDGVRQNVAHNTSTPAEALATLAKDEDDGVRQNVAHNTSTPAEVLATLAKDKDVDIRQYVASNTSASAEALAMLAKDKDGRIRQCVAENTSTPVEALAMLAKNENILVRQNVAYNTSTPAEVLTILAKDENVYVRYGITYNTSTPVEVLAMLAKDEDAFVRYGTALNTSTPAEALALLAKDENTNVRQKAQNTLNKISKIRTNENENVLRKNILREFVNKIFEIDVEDIEDIKPASHCRSTHHIKTCTHGGDLYYLKFSAADEIQGYASQLMPNLQMIIEYLAYKIYQLYNIPVPQQIHLVFDKKNERIGIATQSLKSSGNLYSWTPNKIALHLEDGIFVDILLANWDVTQISNLVLVDDDVLYRIDPGGAMTFRAQGARKSQFGEYPNELDTMLRDQTPAGYIYQYADLEKAGKVFMRVSHTKLISALTDEVKKIMAELLKYGDIYSELRQELMQEYNNLTKLLTARYTEIIRHISQ